MNVEFYGLIFDLPDGWTDITDDLPQGSPPSLARPVGAGAVQFSVARHGGGAAPHITLEDLRGFLGDFFATRGLNFDKVVERSGSTFSVVSSVFADREMICAGYFSNGRDTAFVSYVCVDVDDPELAADISGVERIFETIRFQASAPGETH